MSPKTVSQVIGELYPCVMQDVIDASLVDFEDAGVSTAILDELKSLWQKGLSNTIIAQFPWDKLPPTIKDEPIDEEQWVEHQNRPSWTPQTAPVISASGFDSGYPQNIDVAALPPTGLNTLQQYHLASPTYNPCLPHSRAQQFYQVQPTYLPSLPPPQHQVIWTAGGRLQGFPGAFSGPLVFLDSHCRSSQQQGGYYTNNVPVMGPDGPSNQRIEYGACGISGPEPSSEKNNNSSLDVKKSSPHSNKNSTVQTHNYTQHQPPEAVHIKIEEKGPTLFSLPEYRHRLPIPVAPPQFKPPSSTSQLDGGDGDADNSPGPIVEDEELNDGDDEEVDGEEGDDFEEVPELCVCLYDKVVRNRSRITHKWKCTLRDGIFITGGKEYPFTKGSAEFTW